MAQSLWEEHQGHQRKGGKMINTGMRMKILRYKEPFLTVAYPLAALLGFVILWELSVRFFEIPSYLLPLPVNIVKEIFSEAGLLLEHGWITTLEALLGLIAGAVLGVITAMIIVWSKALGRTVMPLVVLTKAFPKVAIAPLLVIWFGFGIFPKIFVTFLICYFPIVINVVAGLISVDSELLDLGKSMSATKLQIFTKVRIPNSLPYFFTGLKLASVLALIGAIVGEFVGGDAGLGFIILIANERMNTSLLFACVIVLTGIGLSFFYIATGIESASIPWKPASEDEGKTLTETAI